MTPRTMLVALISAAGCGDKGEEGDSKKPGGGDDSAGDSGSGWEAAPVRPGGYKLTVTAVTDAGCDDRLATGDVSIATVVPGHDADEGYVMLWGYARMEYDGESALRANGNREGMIPDTDCVVAESLQTTGTMENEQKFTLDIALSKTGTGADCASQPFATTCTLGYSGTFEWEPPPDTGGG